MGGAMAVDGSDLFVSDGLPSVVAVDGPDLFATAQDRIAEVDLATGRVVRTMSGKAYHLGVVSKWSSVIELNVATGAVVRVISEPVYGFRWPAAILVHGGEVLIANESDPVIEFFEASPVYSSVTELDARTGRLIGVLRGPRYGFAGPVALTLVGNEVFVANTVGNSLTVLPVATASPATGTPGLHS